ncbi:MAG TPA: radical SAM protein [Polyangia bacterium]
MPEIDVRPIGLRVAALELTLECPCRCQTCGSNAGAARDDELSVSEWLGVVNELADLGCKWLTLMGGEPLVSPAWPAVARAAVGRGMVVDMVTSGVGMDATTAAALFEAGLSSVTVSVDGTAQVHNRLRGVPDGHAHALRAIGLLDAAGLRVGVTTQINGENIDTLEALAPELQSAGAMGWQLQLTIPVGRAAGAHLAAPPERMAELHQVLRRLAARPGLRPTLTDNLGYCTADDVQLRTPARASRPRQWLGCFAGLAVAGVTSNGTVKGCLALPDACGEGNVRHEPFRQIWGDPKRFAYNRAFDPASLSGACADCEHGRHCRGGCTALAMAFHGRPGVSQHCFRLHGVG